MQYATGLLNRGTICFLSAVFTIAMATESRAALVLNLVFPNGSNSMNITPSQAGQDIPVLVYGVVTGVNAVTQTPGVYSGNFDGIDYAYYNLVSSATSGNALAGAIDSGATNPLFSPQLNGIAGSNAGGFAAQGSQNGKVQDLNGDGIADLGSNTVIGDIAKPRAGLNTWNNSVFAPDSPTGAPSIIVSGSNNNVVSFLLETVYFHMKRIANLGSVNVVQRVASEFGQLRPLYPDQLFCGHPEFHSRCQPGGSLYVHHRSQWYHGAIHGRP